MGRNLIVCKRSGNLVEEGQEFWGVLQDQEPFYHYSVYALRNKASLGRVECTFIAQPRYNNIHIFTILNENNLILHYS